MAASVAGTAAGCTAFECPSLVPSPAKSSSSLRSSRHVFLSCSNGTKAALIPSCLSFALRSWNFTALPVRNYRDSRLPSNLCSSSPISCPHSSLPCLGNGEILGVTVGVYGAFERDSRRAGLRKNPRTAGRNVRSTSGPSEVVLEDTIRQKNAQSAVVVYSKSWCPYCSMVKSLFTDIGVSIKVIELDQLIDGEDVQEALTRLTGQSTVPSVFIGGKHIGGCDGKMPEKRMILQVLVSKMLEPNLYQPLPDNKQVESFCGCSVF